MHEYSLFLQRKTNLPLETFSREAKLKEETALN